MPHLRPRNFVILILAIYVFLDIQIEERMSADIAIGPGLSETWLYDLRPESYDWSRSILLRTIRYKRPFFLILSIDAQCLEKSCTMKETLNSAVRDEYSFGGDNLQHRNVKGRDIQTYDNMTIFYIYDLELGAQSDLVLDLQTTDVDGNPLDTSVSIKWKRTWVIRSFILNAIDAITHM